jgi:hypothetical protein
MKTALRYLALPITIPLLAAALGVGIADIILREHVLKY